MRDTKSTTVLKNTTTTTTATTMTMTSSSTMSTATKRRRRHNFSTWTVTLVTAAAVVTSSSSSFFPMTTSSSSASSSTTTTSTTSTQTESTATASSSPTKPTLLVRGEDTESHQLRAAANSYHQHKRMGKRKDEQTTPSSSRTLQDQPSASSSTPFLQNKNQVPSGVSADRLLTIHKQQHEDFLEWCKESLGISSSLVEIAYFEYYDFIRAMDDRVDIFCEDCSDPYQRFEDSHGNVVPSSIGTINYSVDDDDYTDVVDPDALLSVTDYPMVPIRGLKAAHDVEVGQVLISIPHRSLWTLSNIVDTDPILEPVMGRKAREVHGWNNPVDEIPLLAVALLYHIGQLGGTGLDGTNSSPHGPYLRLLLNDEHGMDIRESIPHLWDSSKLRHSTTPAVRKVAKGIKNDVAQLYDSIMIPLIEEHPHLFARQDDNNTHQRGRHHHHHGTISHDMHDTAGEVVNDDDRWKEGGGFHKEYDDDVMGHDHDHFDDKDRVLHHDHLDDVDARFRSTEWMFSLDRFHWAFALVNSRHWHLPIPKQVRTDNENRDGDVAKKKKGDVEQPSKDGGGDDHQSFTDQEGPPATMPTDGWLDYKRELQRQEEEHELESVASSKSSQGGNDGNNNVASIESGNDDDEDYWPAGDSFLAPVADLLNFGPPCTRGVYNVTTNSFEIIATCPFRKGQEITFWYTDACEDVFVANYGFTMPMMVPKCTTEADRVHQLNADLSNAYEDLDRLDQELDLLLDVLHDCHCDNQTVLAVGLSALAATSTTNNNNRNNNINRHGDITQPIPYQKRGQDGDARRTGGGGSGSGRQQRSILSRKTRSNGTIGRNSRTARGGTGSDNGGRNDAKHAIRGGRRPSGSSPKGVLRRASVGGSRKRGSSTTNGNVQSRKSEF